MDYHNRSKNILTKVRKPFWTTGNHQVHLSILVNFHADPHSNTDPDPGQPNQCRSGSTTLRKMDICTRRAFTGLGTWRFTSKQSLIQTMNPSLTLTYFPLCLKCIQVWELQQTRTVKRRAQSEAERSITTSPKSPWSHTTTSAPLYSLVQDDKQLLQ